MDKNQAKLLVLNYLSNLDEAKKELAKIKIITNLQEQHEKAESAHRKHSTYSQLIIGHYNSYNLSGEVNSNSKTCSGSNCPNLLTGEETCYCSTCIKKNDEALKNLQKNQQDINNMVDDFQQGLNDYVENQKKQNATKTPAQQADLTKKKQKLTELENKQKKLDQQLPLTTQITILEREIKELENKSARTQTEEALLTSKKKELAELLKKEDSSNASDSSKPKDKTALYVGCGVVGLFTLLLIFVLIKYQNRGFSYEECKEWINIGVLPTNYDYANYLREKYQTPKQCSVIIGSGNHNFNYSFQKRREEIKKIETGFGKELYGELIIENFPELNDITFFRSKNITKLKISNCPKLTRFYTSSSGNRINNLIINNCPKLSRFNAEGCSLTSIDIDKISCSNIGEFDINYNLLTDFDFTKLNPEKLTYLNIAEGGGEPNSHFYGSLEPLKNMTKLNYLDIIKTNIDSGIEYLPESVKKVYIESEEDEDFGTFSCTKLMEELKDYYYQEDEFGYYDIQA
ncbi:1576_t:CDS:2 [Entrophospora sp. SA101]|nr:1576_t:CDS:2 [Entrophospora sp. SA101]